MLSVILLSVLSVILLSLLVAHQWWNQKLTTQLLEQQSLTLQAQMSEHQKTVQTLTKWNEKAQALVASSDPLAFQQIQAMTQTLDYSGYQDYDPSDEAEAERIAARNPNLAAGDDLDAQDARQLFAELTGVDPEFYGN
jgi:sensor c-di-GMP phosphodiesterase-like protein